MKKILLLIILLLAWRHFYYVGDAPKLGPGVFVSAAPYQDVTSEGSFSFNGFTLTPKANFIIDAKVLSAERYYFDREAQLSPVDFALGWGAMSDEQVLEKITVSQKSRWYHWSSDDLPISRQEVESSSANMHLIPATEVIAEQIKSVRIGELVSIEGQLVDIKNSSGWKWQTSTNRTDTGKGACEIIFVRSIRTIEPHYY